MAFLELDGFPEMADNPREVNGDILVGSGSQASWRVARLDLAARHFMINATNGSSATLTPVNSDNVVILNGAQVPVAGTPLNPGDVIGAGSARFVFLASRTSERPKLPPTINGHLIDVNQKKGWTLTKRVVQIGREIGCSIVLKDPTVSRFHADVRSEGGEHVFYSMGSSGSWINGEAVSEPRVLNEGDDIKVGQTRFTFTKLAFPPDVTPTEFEDHQDDRFARRATVVDMKPISSVPRPSAPSSTATWVGVAVVVAVVAGVAWLLFFR